MSEEKEHEDAKQEEKTRHENVKAEESQRHENVKAEQDRASDKERSKPRGSLGEIGSDQIQIF